MEYFKSKRLLVTIIIVLVVLNGASIAFMLFSSKWFGPFADKPSKEAVRNFTARELDFSAEQKQQFGELLERHFKHGDSMAVRHSQALGGLFDLLKKESATPEEVRQYASTLGEIESDRAITTYEHFRAVRSLCSPEQKKKFDIFVTDVLKKTRDPQWGQKPQNK
jgi:Spy/CpxP family protein refolding chaperone